MAPSSLPHQEDPNKISLECGRDAGTAEHIWLDVASSVQIQCHFYNATEGQGL